ncbi:MAG: hypothetical protein RLZZ64_1001, partial [Bacteroidota bacterium]
MKMLVIILRKEFRQILRNPAILRLIFVMPILQLIILPNAADYEIKNINLFIVDHDHSSLSRRLTENISASNYFILMGYGNDRKQAVDAIEKDAADLILEIPSNFERNLVKEEKAKLLLAVNAINGVKANLGGAYLNSLIRQFNGDIRTEWLVPDRTQRPSTVQTTSSNWFNPDLNYKYFMVPGILVILL